MEDLDRRTLIKGATAGVGAVGLARALAPMAELAPKMNMRDFLQTHYTELTQDEMALILKKIEDDTLRDHGVAVKVEDVRPQEGVEFGYALNLSVCNGCRKCAEACAEENNHDKSTNQSYIVVLEMDKGTLALEHTNRDYDHDLPGDKFYLPVQCHQCANPPCVTVCPVEATWREDDGIIVVDYDWCIGCRYCEAACPYHARRFNWHAPEIAPEDINPDQGYLSNRIRPAGVVEKCTFCLHRTRKGLNPACLDACPTGARVFGNLLDPNSDIRWVLENKRVFVLKEDLGTEPRFYYYFDK